jgi:GrpB-like predicted nucleotidyltransferase (UPF0157 family)
MNENPPKIRDMTNMPYDPEWPIIFNKIQSILSSKLNDLVISIEHVGSTSIPGIPAKPRLDIDIIIDTIEKLPLVISKLEELGYYSQRSLETEGREVLGRIDDTVPYDGNGTLWMKQNVYICLMDSPFYREHILFRDHLNSHPDLAQEYGNLKIELAEKHRNDQDAYVQGKHEFVQGVLSELC